MFDKSDISVYIFVVLVHRVSKMKLTNLFLSLAFADVFDFSTTDKEQNGT